MPTSFCDHALSEDLSIVQINVASLLHVTHAVLPRMLAQHRGLVLNIGSFSGAFPSPLLSVYSGAKAFVQAWSQCLSAEVAGTGVHVELVNAYFVVSNLSKIRRPSLVAPTPKAYVASVLRKLGVPCGSIGRPYSITPYWTHALGDWAVQHYAPKAWLLRYVTDMHKDIRRRALKKQERLAKKN
ncbi:NAD(P)-binding protein [Calocera cornea HHB12733]|uniref:NAD(P)-binding protein n=1 Tax=Calocera cornea HHB12733 TaxID=1353952 RepID=A0A165GYT6_9BASI|nr:NAD(P)-binding protein [Calocera cornea HHB12733]